MVYGELEKYLGERYADDLTKNRELKAIHEECREVLYGSLSVLEMFSKVDMAMKSLHQNRTRYQ